MANKEPHNLQRRFFDAVHQADLPAVRALAKEAPDMFHAEWNPGGGSFLHLAASGGHAELCAELVKLGLDVNEATLEAGVVPLHKAANSGSVETLKTLLALGALVDGLPTSRGTPLMAAAADGHLPAVQLLIEHGAEINREHLEQPYTALDWADFYDVKESGQAEVAAWLREHGGICPYSDAHPWTGVSGQAYIEHIERALGGFVNPIALSEPTQSGAKWAIRRARIPTKYDFQLIFTVGPIHSGPDFALCLPAAWPLNSKTLGDLQFDWPIRALTHLKKQSMAGKPLAVGDVADFGSMAPPATQWVVARNAVIDAEREGDSNLPETLMLCPVAGKKPIEPGASAGAAAEKAFSAKWKALAVPLKLATSFS